MPLVPGTLLGTYKIGAPLGAGGMGEVYRALDARLDRTVAIKVLPEQLSNDPVRRQRFEREAKIISSLNRDASDASVGAIDHAGEANRESRGASSQ